MHWKHLRAAMLAVVGMVLAANAPASAEPGDIIEIGPGAYPQWSPDGKYLAFIRDGHVFVTPSDGNGQETRIARSRGKNYLWASDTQLVFGLKPRQMPGQPKRTVFESVSFKRPSDSGGKYPGIANVGDVVTLAEITEAEAGGAVLGPVLLGNGCVGYEVSEVLMSGPARLVSLDPLCQQSNSRHSQARIIILKDGKRPHAPWGQLWLTWYGASDEERRNLTTNENWGLPIMSPNRDLVLVADGRGGHFIIDTLGNVVNPRWDELVTFPDGRFEDRGYYRWSPDQSFISFISAKSDGHFSEHNRLLLRSVSGETEFELLGPQWGVSSPGAWSPLGDRIAVETQSSGIVIVEVEE